MKEVRGFQKNNLKYKNKLIGGLEEEHATESQLAHGNPIHIVFQARE